MTSESEKTVFYPQAFFLHERLLTQDVPEPDNRNFEEWVNSQPTQMHRNKLRARRCEQIVTNIYQSRPQELAVWLMNDRTVGDSELVTTTQRFYFRKVSDTRRSFRAPSSVDKDVTVEGRFSISRCVGDTGIDMLRQSRRVTVLGYARVVETNPKVHIEISPLFIGWIVERPESEDAPIFDYTDRRQIWASQVDQFEKIKDAPKATAEMRKEVSAMPEDTVKQHFAEIIGEPYVGKDWGGEKSDLFTSRLTIDGQPVSVGFAFKGPGKKGKLTISAMGTNGDQALRLFEEPIDIGVVQHHREIVPAVNNLLDALARQHNAQYMVIDGETTAQILSAYGYLSSVPEQSVMTDDDDDF
ncbi:hypothetical protein [Pseudarthrobacter sp. fls2-241-R2A-168]|uniref:hypothetical protein n=1 Tax=Pseudarthrobacter sp. fls2-241-R2A-168 TaxID=3040304 RepID=UPI002556B209|nr:hypothetical protein [Pseudarthrobacter sp. fls2-241-R2A-168]